MIDKTSPIGLFDSGIGGLTVARHVMQVMPSENLVYFGDTARVPYGSKSTETVVGYSLQAAAFLESMGVKLIIVACNTASAVALDTVRSFGSVPVVGVITPGATAAIRQSRNGAVGVIGTEGTIRSGAYQRAVTAGLPEADVVAQACPLLVSLAEEGWTGHPATNLIIRDYLKPLLAHSIDALILGCTHYPILEADIGAVAGPRVTMIDPGLETALQARAQLDRIGLLNDSTSLPRYEYFLSDFPHKFVEVGERFLGRPLDHVRRVHLEELPPSALNAPLR